MDGVCGHGLLRAVNVGGIGDGHQLAIANMRNGGRLAITKCCAARKRLEGGLEDVRIEKMRGVLEPLRVKKYFPLLCNCHQYRHLKTR